MPDIQLLDGKKIPFEIIERRDGDVAESFANPSLAEKVMG